MFDQKTVRATPGNARRLLEFSRLNGATMPGAILELAQSASLDVSPLRGSALELDTDEVKVLQRLADWGGRGIILDDGNDRARKIALANVKLRGKGPTLILVHPQSYVEWSLLIRENWPEAKISVFGNPRYRNKRDAFPDGVGFAEEPDIAADFIITSCGSVHWFDLLGKVTPAQSIIEELDSPSAFGYKFIDALKGLFLELNSPVMIQNINRLPTDSTTDILTNLQTHASKAMIQLATIITDYLWCGNSVANSLLGGPKHIETLDYSPRTGSTNSAVSTYLHRRGYSGVDIWRMLPVLGVSTELVTGKAGKPMEFNDHTVADALRRQNKKSSGLTRIAQRERELEDHTGQSLEHIARRAADGDTSAAALITGLRTTQWANAKASSIREVIASVGSRLSRTLVIAEHPDLVRALKLTLTFSSDNRYTTSEDLASSVVPEATLARFLYPDPSCFMYVPSDKVDTRPLNTLIIRQQDLDNPDLLKVANFVVLAEWPTDRATYQVIKEDYVEANGARLIHTTLVGTVEEQIKKILTQKP